MVLKLSSMCGISDFWFYSSVILNGTETGLLEKHPNYTFYSSVILNGTETVLDVRYQRFLVLQ